MESVEGTISAIAKTLNTVHLTKTLVALIMSATQRVKKRKVDLDHRTFNPEWEKYFFIERFGQAQCLICLKTKAVNAEAEKVTRASYEVFRILARRMKPFAGGDSIKECLLAVVDSVCPEQRSAFESVNLSSRTVRRRIEDMSDNVHNSFKKHSSMFVAFSLALDKSTDTKDTAQLVFFIRGVTADLQVCEEFLQLVPLRGTTTGQDICDAILQCVDQHSLDLSHLVCVTTDGAPAMSLCAKSANLVDVMSLVVKVVNSILSHSLNHRQFQVTDGQGERALQRPSVRYAG
ncbi:general transcription factor II-I repeat domain-containing protein 2-like [Oratosquilla oratoria]|uniref:general transcription factor II-I repeat domain-containing protein 2-like n=1 Tax=Oratosquilla oratoria TaxID=337810 RepID=UPI003F761EEE